MLTPATGFTINPIAANFADGLAENTEGKILRLSLAKFWAQDAFLSWIVKKLFALLSAPC